MEPNNPLLDDYVLRASGKEHPNVCFVATASGDSALYVRRFYGAFPEKRCKASHLKLFDRDDTDLRAHLLSQDVIYVGGGSTANLLAIWRLHGVDAIMREAWQQGIVLSGISAGMLCWFEGSVTDSFGPLSALKDGLGVLQGSACPHFHGEAGREAHYLRYVSEGILPGGFGVDDGAALHFVATQLHCVVASGPEAKAYRVSRNPGGASITPLETQFLGASAPST